jgi:flagellar basal body-associated protein FliL
MKKQKKNTKNKKKTIIIVLVVLLVLISGVSIYFGIYFTKLTKPNRIVGLSINNGWTLMTVLLFLLIFNLCGSSHIYNPLFYIFGYHYYYVTSSKTKILVMTKTKYPLGATADFEQCGCLNDYTYIDISKNNE